MRKKPWRLSAPGGVIVLTIDPHTYTPSHGPQQWTPEMARYYISVVRCTALLREDRENSKYFSWNIWIYSRRGAWVANLAFRNGQRRYGVEPMTPRPFGGLEIDEYWNALKAAMAQERDGPMTEKA